MLVCIHLHIHGHAYAHVMAGKTHHLVNSALCLQPLFQKYKLQYIHGF